MKLVIGPAPALALCTTLVGFGVGAAGCARSSTDIQLRDAADHASLVGQSIATTGPLHGEHWSITDTLGVAHVSTKRGWSALDITVADAAHRPEARGTLLAGATAWVPLKPEPGSTRRIEARLASGEGAPPPPSAPKTDQND